jgi:hypothetical protein
LLLIFFNLKSIVIKKIIINIIINKRRELNKGL